MIRVDGVEIPEEALSLEAQLQDAEDPAAAWEAAARALVVRQLLLNEAAARGHTGRAAPPRPGEEPDEAAIRHLLEAELRLPEPREAELLRWYDANAAAHLRGPDLWHVRHLLIAADPRDAAARRAAEARARGLLAEALADPALLPELARRHSDCPSRGAGGDLGLVERGSTVPEFEAALARLEPGEVCPEVVPTRYGMHVVHLLHSAEGRVPPFEAVRARIAEFLEEASWRRAVQGYVGALAARARIEGFDLFAGVADAPPQGAWPAGGGCTAAAAAPAPPAARRRA